MKKTFVLVIAIWITACVIGCSSPEDTVPAQPEGFQVSCMGKSIAMDAPAAPVIEALGEPRTYTEAASCAFEGLDKTYYYGGFYMTTYPAKDGDRIRSLWFADDSLTTQEGITIGSARAAVEQAYGADCLGGKDSCTLTQGNSTLTIVLKNSVVTAIRYDAVLE